MDADPLSLVRVRMEDGAVVELPRAAAEDLYGLLWMLAPQPGALTTAAKLHHALRNALVDPVDLDERESRVFDLARASAGT